MRLLPPSQSQVRVWVVLSRADVKLECAICPVGVLSALTVT